jgi:hypothetical protein
MGAPDSLGCKCKETTRAAATVLDPGFIGAQYGRSPTERKLVIRDDFLAQAHPDAKLFR